ncbi:glycosyltransferase family 2 protein [Ruicaihuangia caeni]|uniref:glycosyltransferase family 2 protein n=1 Tax=Ruicaihuangia caeni TaxID=3042517 RepID=UPI00338D9946
MIVLVIVLLLGVSTLVWSVTGIARLLFEQRRATGTRARSHPGIGEVAVLMAAHNEAEVIGEALEAATGIVEPGQVFVVSDGSKDATAQVARALGVNVIALPENVGKAAALEAGIEHFRLLERFQVVTFLDADTRLSPDYFTTGLPLFDDDSVAAVAGRATTLARSATAVGRFLLYYRERLYVMVQYLHKYGQAAPAVNAVSVVPGFASMYRTRALRHIDIAVEGLAIEDFNMTFEVHAKRLGRVAFHPARAVAQTQDPDTVRDYCRQMARWSLGFWQTLIRHRASVRLRAFWAALALFAVEMLSGSVLLLLLPAFLVLWSAAWGVRTLGLDPGGSAGDVAALPVGWVLLALFVADYLLTVVVAAITRDPRYLILGLAFPIVRVVDAVLCVRSLLGAAITRSDGIWESPRRRAGASTAVRAFASTHERDQVRA